MSAPENDSAGGSVGVRWPELGVALFLMAIGTMVIIDSIRVGTGWGDDGPRSGYFPFYIGLALLLSAAWIAITQLRHWSRHAEFAERGQLRSVMAILWPMVAFVALIPFLGIYLASIILISYFMLRHGKHNPALTAGVALGTPLAFFLVFERWFLVPLPKGPIEAMLGF